MWSFITLLSDINSPADLKKLDKKDLPVLAKEIRKEIIEVVGSNGGHLASNLGVVELTIALHRNFESPKDAFVWDVSHQCYTHKILTGRYKDFSTLRQRDGLSGFTKRSESPHDFFDAGHSSTSVSSALGLLTGRCLQNKDGHVVAIIGDGALTGGMALEGLSHAGQLEKNLIVVLNDNQMSISENTGSISRYLSRLTMTSSYQNFRFSIDKFVSKIPFVNSIFTKFIFRIKRALKALFYSNNLFVDLGFEYVGPLNGHNIDDLEKVFSRVKKLQRPVVVHVVTKKGRGYSPAENDPAKFHGIGPFCISDGTVEKFDTLSFTEAFSNSLLDLAEKNEKIVAITAAMSKGTGLAAFARRYPERFFDVGIAEQHAVTFAGGLSVSGLIPVTAIYSTFMQRSIDQLIHDIALPNLPSIFMLDRSGAVPDDGETHQGAFDIALISSIPNIVIMTPASAIELKLFLDWAVFRNGPVVIRYPKSSCPSEQKEFSFPVEEGRGVLLTYDNFAPAESSKFSDNEKSVLIVCTGGLFSEALTAARDLILQDIPTDIYNIRFIKPFDEEYFLNIAKNYDYILIAEDGVFNGGIAQKSQAIILKAFPQKKIITRNLPDYFMALGKRFEILHEAGLASCDLTAAIKNCYKS